MPQDDPLSSAPPPPSGGSDDGPNPIGVPKGYSVPKSKQEDETRRGGPFHYTPKTTIYDANPIYFDGDEYIPANWPATQIWQLQQALAKIGLLTGSFTKHVWDNTTRNAYKELLALANAQGVDANRALQQMLSSVGEDGAPTQWKVDEFGNIIPVGGGADGPPPLVTRTTDPAALRQTFRRAVIDMLGEGWSQEEINKMVAAYNNVEIQRQTQAYNMDINEQGGNIESIPSPEAFIQAQVLEKDPVGAQTHEALGFVDEFMQLAGGPAWGVS